MKTKHRKGYVSRHWIWKSEEKKPKKSEIIYFLSISFLLDNYKISHFVFYYIVIKIYFRISRVKIIIEQRSIIWRKKIVNEWFIFLRYNCNNSNLNWWLSQSDGDILDLSQCKSAMLQILVKLFSLSPFSLW